MTSGNYHALTEKGAPRETATLTLQISPFYFLNRQFITSRILKQGFICTCMSQYNAASFMSVTGNLGFLFSLEQVARVGHKARGYFCPTYTKNGFGVLLQPHSPADYWESWNFAQASRQACLCWVSGGCLGRVFWGRVSHSGTEYKGESPASVPQLTAGTKSRNSSNWDAPFFPTGAQRKNLGVPRPLGRQSTEVFQPYTWTLCLQEGEKN